MRAHLFQERLERRFHSKVRKTDSCWLWGGVVLNNGYGQMDIKKKGVLAHRFSYELHKGEIPNGLVIDHLCRVKNCVNPDHLEPVTVRENSVRGDTVTKKKSGLPIGVDKARKKYLARKVFNGKNYRIALFDTPEDASIAYQTAILVS